MNILVTGCAGFIGAHVTRLLLAQGQQVLGLDWLKGPGDENLKRQRLHQLKHQAFRFCSFDLRNHTKLSAILNTTPGFSAVAHLAARTGVRDSVRFPELYWRTNVDLTQRLLDLCVRLGIPKFVLASTSSVYGNGPTPFKETQKPEPLNPYAQSKLEAERRCHEAHTQRNLDITILRYFTVYGPLGRPDMAVDRFIKKISAGVPVPIFGDGTQKRDFTYVEDIAQGTIAALKPLGCQTINLGASQPTSVLNLLQLIEQHLGKNAILEQQSSNPADATQTFADTQLAQRLLGWRNKTSLQQGLQWVIQSWQEEIIVR